MWYNNNIIQNKTDDLPFEQTDELSPGSPLSVPLSWSSLRSESAGPPPTPAGPAPWPPPPPLLPEDARPCRDRSRGPSVDEAGDTGEPPPLLRPLSDSMSVIMNRDLPRWCMGMVPAAEAAVSSCTVIAVAVVVVLLLPMPSPPVATAAASPAGHCRSKDVLLRPDDCTVPPISVAVVIVVYIISLDCRGFYIHDYTVVFDVPFGSYSGIIYE